MRHEAEQQPVTARDEAGEPSGADDPSAEKEILEATEQTATDGGKEAEETDSADAALPVEDAGAEADDSSERTPLERERDEYLDLARRTQADFENYRKRAAKEAAAAGERARGGLVRELLPVVDNLERALGSASDEAPTDQPGSQLAEGVKLVHSELISVLERNGVEQFDPQGESFDPTVHEALSTRSQDGADAGTVLDVVEKGYRSGGKVLRPARVVVAG